MYIRKNRLFYDIIRGKKACLGTAIINMREKTMKKLLGVSFAAILAVVPMMASAAEGDRTGLAALTIKDATANTNIATTSYVKGAYNAVAQKVNTLVSDTAIATDGEYIKAGKTVAFNLDALDDQVKANASAIQALGGTGSIADQISTGAQNGTFTPAGTSGISSTNIKDAINEVGTDLEDVKDDIATLNGDANTTGSVDNKIAAAIDDLDDDFADKQDKSDSTVTTSALTSAQLTEGTDLNADAGVAANLIKVASKAKTNASNIATNTADIATINNKVINMVSDWGSDTVVKAKISDLADYVAPGNGG